MHKQLAISLILTCILLPGLASVALAQEERTRDTPPQQETRGDIPRADILFPNEAPISLILEDFQAQTGVAIALKGKTNQLKIAFQGNQLTPEAFLDNIATANNLRWRKVKGVYELWDEESYQQEVIPGLLEQKVFIPVHISAKYLFEAIKSSNILTPKHGNLALDERTNKVIVTDLPEKLALIQDMVNLLDEPQYTRVFYIRYADVAEIVDKITELKSEAGTIESDEIAHLIIVRDVLANIQRMEALIDLLDVRQMRRVYNLNSVGAEGESLDLLQQNLETLITPDAFYVIDADRGLLILEDTEEVHEDVEKFLQVFDRPIDQVRIEAELLDVVQSTNLTYGLNFEYNMDGLGNVVNDVFVPLGEAGGLIGESSFGFVSQDGGLSANYLTRRTRTQLTAALTDNNTQILLRPRVTVKNGEQVKLHSGKKTPITQVTPLSYNSTVSTNYSITTTQVDSGLTLEMTPYISPTGLVEIEIHIENSSADRVELNTGVESQPIVQGVETTEAYVDTVLTIPDGETRVISGIVDHSNKDQKGGVPFLVQIPVIGPLLFGSREKNDRIRNLTFFVTPIIIRETPKGQLVEFDFDEMQATNEWITRETPRYATPAARQPQDIDPTQTPWPDWQAPQETEQPRFDAPTPELQPQSSDTPSTQSGALPPPAEGWEDLPDTPEALQEALGDNAPPERQGPTQGWSGTTKPNGYVSTGSSRRNGRNGSTRPASQNSGTGSTQTRRPSGFRDGNTSTPSYPPATDPRPPRPPMTETLY